MPALTANVGRDFAPKPVFKNERIGITIDNHLNGAAGVLALVHNLYVRHHLGGSAKGAAWFNTDFGGVALAGRRTIYWISICVSLQIPGRYNAVAVGATVPTDIKRTRHFLGALRASPGIFHLQSMRSSLIDCRQRLFGDQFELFALIAAHGDWR
jgi:hypothetical protein